ncbi:carbamoyltransferase HypF [Nonomuraea sp. B5E05]|uniref:carbamoyltransferase HypF n=1 Tax=Nonomuraea sp. B5E05 TaxID=3153569 RepID=UPI0032612DEF
MGVRVRVEGVVQGVGFRPFVHGLATRLGLAGRVGNDARGVFVELDGERDRIAEFLTRLERDAPPLAAIERVTVTPTGRAAAGGEGRFLIVASERSGTPRTLVSPDIATCADCLAELADPADRRYRYPFVNCVNCGPRLTITRALPYDRPLTTMAGFAMCDACLAEYHDPADRRFHAQPVCCPACGPALRLVDARDTPQAGGDVPAAAARVLRGGGVLAVKGLGGYHLAVVATDERAAAELRRRKRRADKPFAVMVADLAQARLLCEVDAVARALLTGRDRPIVLLPRRTDISGAVADAVAPGQRHLGLMLPYTPLHHLLLAETGAPIVLTSANLAGEPIEYDDRAALDRLGGMADAFLTHDRPIHLRADDSVTRVVRGRGTLLRRSRGHAPAPFTLPWEAPRPVLGCGAALKNTFCLVRGRHAVVSPHLGDLEGYEALRAYAAGIEHFSALLGVRPEVAAHDLHPDYPSTRYALSLPDAEPVPVQHHHAHIASCLADNGEHGRVIGVAFDGLGYGADGTLWGGEFLLADLVSFERAGHLAPVPMPGGQAAVRQPWRMAAAYLAGLDGAAGPCEAAVARRAGARWESVTALARRGGAAAPLTSSAGRLFDAVAALAGVRDTITYEGQAAIELEQLADPMERGAYPAGIARHDGVLVVAGADLVRAALEDLAGGAGPPVVSARFHNGVRELIVRCCTALREETGLTTVALSGGVFQNVLLAERTVERLERAGFRVLTHAGVPAGDGGISLGQAAVAAARDLFR